MRAAGLQVVPLDDGLRPWALELVRERWGSTRIVTRGRVHRVEELAGYVALLDGEPAGLVTYHPQGSAWEIVSLDSLIDGKGVGTALIETVRHAAIGAGARRLWLITTNDNLGALRFYQRRGFRLSALYPGAMDEARALKPEIPPVGEHGIPIRDEIELVIDLAAGEEHHD